MTIDQNKLDIIYKAIDVNTRPPMPKSDALDLLEELAADVESRIEALKDEILGEAEEAEGREPIETEGE